MSEVIENIFLFIRNIPLGWFDAFRHYFNYKGRTNRAGFWFFAIMNSLIALFLYFMSYYFDLVYSFSFLSYSIGTYLLFTIYILLTLVPSFCLCIRRLHDLNLMGFWVWIWIVALFLSLPYVYVNFVCQWFLLFVSCYPSSDNIRYGKKPEISFTT